MEQITEIFANINFDEIIATITDLLAKINFQAILDEIMALISGFIA